MIAVIVAMTRESGGVEEFPTVAEAIVWAQRQEVIWRARIDRIFSGAVELPYQPAQAMKRLADELSNFTAQQIKSRSEPVLFSDDDLIVADSVVGTCLVMVGQSLGSAGFSAALAAFSESLGPVRWGDAEAVSGVAMFNHLRDLERSKRLGAISNGFDERIDEIGNRLNFMQERQNSIAQEAGGSSQVFASTIKNMHGALESIRSKFEISTSDLRDSYELAASTIERSVIDTRERLRDLEQEGMEARTAHETSLLGWREEQEASLNAYIASQRERHNLQQPARLWSDRASIHGRKAVVQRRWAIGIGIAGLLSTVGAAWGAFNFAGWIMTGSDIASGFSLDAQSAATLKRQVLAEITLRPERAAALRPTFGFELIFATAATLLYLTIYIWVMRILVKVYSTEHHLSIDASGRSAMVETYLGLIEAKAANEQDRPIVLGAIFAPVVDGFVTEEGPPQLSLPAIVAAAISGKGNGAAS